MLRGDLMERKFFKRGDICVDIYTDIYMIHFAVQHKLTQHCKTGILQF